ncbi:unnamed protein product [marine sediment metagenome]|uniref:Uncharacterized protein n=1 Tax=marine sediment metagenome TaxID=412755 RepID=X0ZQH1_9ZZZZ
MLFDKINTIDAFINRLYYKHTSEDYYIILAMDGETFGHHVKHAINNFLIPLFGVLPHRNDVKLCNVSEIIDKFPNPINRGGVMKTINKLITTKKIIHIKLARNALLKELSHFSFVASQLVYSALKINIIIKITISTRIPIRSIISYLY